jgi:hypothetical protein
MRLPQFIAMTLAFALCTTIAIPATAQQSAPSPEFVARMAKEKEARRACKLEICTAFANPATGPLACEFTKTWTKNEVLDRVVGGTYVWGYGFIQCTMKVNMDRAAAAKAMSEPSATLALTEHTMTCNVEDKDPAKGIAFTIKASITPVVTFEKGEAKSAKIDPVKTEGSTMASAAVTSIMAVDKLSGVVSKAIVGEVNSFLFAKCKEDGVEIAKK